jgi:DNA-binding CsgD family transcriptional regulator
MLIRDTILNLLPFGIVVVTPGGGVVLSNSIARELLQDGELLAIDSGMLVANSKVYQKALTEAISLASRKKERHASGFSMVRQGVPPISVSVAPLNNGNGASGKGIQRNVLVLVSDPTCHIATDPKLIAKMFDFTPSEALVAGHLIEGEDVDEIAQELNLSTYTVRNHLKRLYSKTNTHKHCALLHVLLRSPAALHLSATPDRVKR